MTGSWILAALHLVALAIGLPAVWSRGRALARPLDDRGLREVFAADTWWGVAAGLWLLTGLLRAFGPFEKGADYYLGNHLFLGKMGLFLTVFALELWPMTTLIRWRSAAKRGAAIDSRPAAAFAQISRVQAVLVLAMVLAATGMARGHGVPH